MYQVVGGSSGEIIIIVIVISGNTENTHIIVFLQSSSVPHQILASRNLVKVILMAISTISLCALNGPLQKDSSFMLQHRMEVVKNSPDSGGQT